VPPEPVRWGPVWWAGCGTDGYGPGYRSHQALRGWPHPRSWPKCPGDGAKTVPRWTTNWITRLLLAGIFRQSRNGALD